MQDATLRHLSRAGFQALTAAQQDQPDSAWNQAASALAQADPMCCRTEWCLAYHETRTPEHPLLLWRRGEAVLAFARHAERRALLPVESGWFFGNPVLGPGGMDALSDWLAAPGLTRAGEMVVLSGLRNERGELEGLLRRFGGSHALHVVEDSVQRHASLDGGVDGWMARRSAHFRRRLRAASRRGADLGVAFERCVPATVEEAQGAFARMLAVEAQSWKGLDGNGMDQPGSREFYAAMLRRLVPQAGARVIFARHDGADIGFVFGGLRHGVYRGQQFSFCDTYRRHSIGNLLQWEQVRWLCEEGARRYDMGPDMAYKDHWTEAATPIVTVAMVGEGADRRDDTRGR